MSKYNYTSVHDLKDLVMIYNDCDDYRVTVWNPTEQQRMKLIFTGSNNVDKTINFIVEYEDENYHSYKWKWALFKIKLKNQIRKLFVNK